MSFDIVPWRLTEQEWLSLSLSPEQQALAYSRAVTSIGKDAPRTSQTHHLLKVQLGIHGHPYTTLLCSSLLRTLNNRFLQLILAWKDLSIPVFHLKDIRTVVSEMSEQERCLPQSLLT